MSDIVCYYIRNVKRENQENDNGRSHGKPGLDRLPDERQGEVLRSAYASRERIVIGQVKADEKPNGITAIPNLLDELYLSGAIVTIDAAGRQKKIVKKIIDKQSDHVISLKGNQETIHDEARELFETKFKNRDSMSKSHEETEKGRGRLVTRKCTQTGWVSRFQDLKEWAGLKSFCQIETTTIDLKTGTETHDSSYFISSLDVNPELVLHVAVKHWSIENPLQMIGASTIRIGCWLLAAEYLSTADG